MRVALIAPPFLPVPPRKYGGTELFIAQLAEGLQDMGVDVVVYTNGQSTVGVETRWLYQDPEWPVRGGADDHLKDFNHSSWAIADAATAGRCVQAIGSPAKRPIPPAAALIFSGR